MLKYTTPTFNTEALRLVTYVHLSLVGVALPKNQTNEITIYGDSLAGRMFGESTLFKERSLANE